MKKIFNQKGFTMVELAIVICLISILAATGFTSYEASLRNSRDAKRKSDLENFRSALELYRADNNFYPATGGGSWTDFSSLESILVPAYTNSLSVDPNTNTAIPYRYQASNAVNGKYYSYCIEAELETVPSTANACTPEIDHNYGVSNP